MRHEGERGDFWGPRHSRHTGGLCWEEVGGEVGRQACCAQGRVLLCVVMPIGVPGRAWRAWAGSPLPSVSRSMPQPILCLQPLQLNPDGVGSPVPMVTSL